MGLSVLTLVRNRRLHLLRLIEGLCRSEIAPDELIVVDLGGPTIVLPVASFQIRVVPLESAPLPLARARNLAASLARHEILLFLDVDCIPMAKLLGLMSSTLDKHDALVCAQIHYLREAVTHCDWQEDVLLRDSMPHPVRAFSAQGIRVENNPGLFWSLAFAVRRSLFNRLGGFDERFVGYGAEDTDFGFRARKADAKLLFLGGAGAFHQYHEVYDPPLQHFDDIIRNAEVFFERWNVWPMDGWLDAFERLGLILRVRDKITKIRPPNFLEVALSRLSPDRGF